MSKAKDVDTTNESDEKVEVPTRLFTFPETSISVEAINLAEATAKHDKLANKKEEAVNE